MNFKKISILIAFISTFSCSHLQRCKLVELPTANIERHKEIINVDEHSIALQGYDPVGYFTQNKPIQGSPAYQAAYKGAIYYFSSIENKTTFEKNPEKYEPQYGGFCGYAASINHISPITVDHFQILDGRLVLQHNDKAMELWTQNIPENMKKADQNWPILSKEVCE